MNEKWTQPPKPYTEATLLRAMETAGKLVDNDELRDALKENGIGRPSTRAAIIETLFKRHYIRKERKNLIATSTGVELIGLIHEELLKSAELTGIWEKKLREIERKSYDASTFLDELKQMVAEVVHSVLSDNTNRRVTTMEETVKEEASKKTAAKGKQVPANRKPPPKKRSWKIRLPMNGSVNLVRYVEKERLSKEKLLTGVPNGRTAAPFANRSDRCRKVSVVPHHAKHIRQITATDTPLLRI